MKKPSKAASRTVPKKIASQPGKVIIRKLPTGVRGLDGILGGGIPEFSFNIIVAPPGCGKTTLAHQIVFANATVKRPTNAQTLRRKPQEGVIITSGFPTSPALVQPVRPRTR